MHFQFSCSICMQGSLEVDTCANSGIIKNAFTNGRMDWMDWRLTSLDFFHCLRYWNKKNQMSTPGPTVAFKCSTRIFCRLISCQYRNFRNFDIWPDNLVRHILVTVIFFKLAILISIIGIWNWRLVLSYLAWMKLDLQIPNLCTHPMAVYGFAVIRLSFNSPITAHVLNFPANLIQFNSKGSKNKT